MLRIHMAERVHIEITFSLAESTVFVLFKGSRVKSYFFSCPANKAFPPPLELFWGKFLLELQKKFFFLSGLTHSIS